MNRKNQVLATSLSLLLSVGMSGGTILPAYAMENAENTEVQTDVATNGNAEQSENGVQSQKEATPEVKEKTSNQAAAQSSSLPDSSKSVKANLTDEEEGEGDTASKGVAVDEKHFPDEGFRKYVSAWFDLDQDGYLSDEEIEKATRVRIDEPEYWSEDSGLPPRYDSSSYWRLLKSIKNVKGIEYLNNLKTLRINLDMACKDVTDLNLSHNTNLKSLWVGVFASEGDDDEGLPNNTTLKSIDVSNCSKLETIDISKCDNVNTVEMKQNDALMQLTTYESKIGNIDVTQCPNLEELYLRSDDINNIDFTKCTKLQKLNLKCSNLTSVDLTKCTQLTNLGLYCEKIKSLNLKQNAELENLALGCKGITSIDLSRNTKLENLDVTESGLTSLDLTKNTELCSFSNRDYTDEDTGEHIQAAPVEVLNFSNSPELSEITAIGRALKKIDVTHNKKLQWLYIYDTSIEMLDLSGNPELEVLEASDDKFLTKLDVSKNSKLEDLYVSNTGLTTLDISKNFELRILDVSNTGIRNLDISSNKELGNLDISNTSIENMKHADFTKHPELSWFKLNNAGIESVKFGKIKNLYGISMKGNHLLEVALDGNELDLSVVDADFNADNQTPTITLEPDQIKNNTVALSDLFSDVSRVTIEKGEGYTYDADAKTITFQDKKNRKFKYTWDTKLFDDGSALLKGTATIQVPNEPEEKPDPKPEVKYDTLTKIKLGTTRYTYDGKVKKPSVTVYIGSTRADASKYKVTYPTGMKNIGSYTVKVTGNQGKFCKGTLTATYRIDPKKVKTPSAKVGKKKVTVKWTKVSGGVKYQMAIAKKGGKYKTYAVSGNSKTVKKLTSKKKYTVKVRAYKKVGKKTYYGDWSKTKTVKVK